MTNKVLELCAKELMVSEGGFTNDPNDRGNWTSGKIGVGELKGTKYGISAMAYPLEDIKNIGIPYEQALTYLQELGGK